VSVAAVNPSSLLAAIPASLREELLKSYSEIVKNYRENRWEPSELNGGKFCEVVYTILRGYVDGSLPLSASKPPNMIDACRALEQAPGSKFPRSIRIQIPRMLISLYEIRNNRGVGHVGGEVDPNRMDATCVLYMTKWILADLIRVFHNVDVKSATEAVDSVVERITPQIWKVNERIRVLDTSLTMKDKTLLLLYNSSAPIKESDLVVWIEHSNPSVYRRDVLRPLHKLKFIEYDADSGMVHISPVGIEYVEKNVL
jgi:hypothetical protein